VPLRLAVAAALLLTFATPVRADAGLTAAVAAVYFARTVDAGLHDIAHQRVMEISSCSGCMNHDLRRSGTAEVLGVNSGMPNPAASIVQGWRGSAVHHAILSDSGWGRIGCAERVVGTTHYFACVLATGGAVASAPRAPPPVTLSLPDTALPR
jgi:hypothetical protein